MKWLWIALAVVNGAFWIAILFFGYEPSPHNVALSAYGGISMAYLAMAIKEDRR